MDFYADLYFPHRGDRFPDKIVFKKERKILKNNLGWKVRGHGPCGPSRSYAYVNSAQHCPEFRRLGESQTQLSIFVTFLLKGNDVSISKTESILLWRWRYMETLTSVQSQRTYYVLSFSESPYRYRQNQFQYNAECIDYHFILEVWKMNAHVLTCRWNRTVTSIKLIDP